KERNGVSLAALKKALAAGGYDVDKNKARVKIAVRGLVSKGTLVQTKGTGASGSFKMNKKAAEPKAKKPAAGGRQEGGSQSQEARGGGGQESGRGQEAQSGRSSSQEAQGGRQEVPEEGEEGSGGGG
ncbi:unnamed protein product, partial [Tetraodon nigroviridis]